ncbi:hypothetical protein OG339_15150 [Streptosporangium sp. NBC_01495]|uniref:hypothetical protein n=2 Tax=unclassified Streptosporangium TaxID=2632669 RepID=UPI002E31492B|nr:hypothetical protein [Streptosporangium sp. NBC_01495]
MPVEARGNPPDPGRAERPGGVPARGRNAAVRSLRSRIAALRRAGAAGPRRPLRPRRFRFPRRTGGERGGGRPYERIVAIAIGLSTITGASASYAAVRLNSQAVDADRQAVVETIQVRTAGVVGHMSSRSKGGQAVQYRTLHAQADAIEAVDPDEARILRDLADGLLIDQYIDRRYLPGAGAAAKWDYEMSEAAVVRGHEIFTVPGDQPVRTARRADALHDRVGHLTLTVVGTLGIVLLLTVARLVAPRWRDRLLRVALGGYGLLTALALWLSLAPI